MRAAVFRHISRLDIIDQSVAAGQSHTRSAVSAVPMGTSSPNSCARVPPLFFCRSGVSLTTTRTGATDCFSARGTCDGASCVIATSPEAWLIPTSSCT